MVWIISSKHFIDAVIEVSFLDLSGVTGNAYYVDDQPKNCFESRVELVTVKPRSPVLFSRAQKQVESVFKGVPGEIEVQVGSLGKQQAFYCP